jgi:hypothetical protein
MSSSTTDGEKTAAVEEYRHRIYLLGLFCLEFSVTESLLHDVVQRLSGLDDRHHQAIFSGLRADAAMGQIRRLLEVNGKSPKLYDDIFTHLKTVLDARNLVLHNGLTLSNIHPDIVSTNSRLALSRERERTIPFTADVLERLLHNTSKVNAHLSRELCRLAPDRHVVLDREFLQEAWRDIPPLQSTAEDTWRRQNTQKVVNDSQE